MFLGSGISGNDLPPKTICLTFDDGPGETRGTGAGPRTLELAQFLNCRKIDAAFFAIGEFASTRMEILRSVAEMGHLIGNHTFDHPRLADGTCESTTDQIGRTDNILSGLAEPLKCFRPPYGWWSSTLAGELNWTTASPYVGPILWDIDAMDWSFWAAGRPVNECVSAYIERIGNIGRGVILMHDGSFEAETRSRNNTLEAVRAIVDRLQQNGYSFVRLDAVPQVREASRVDSVIALQTATGHYLSPQIDGDEVLANAAAVGPSEPLGAVQLDESRIALRCLSGNYISVENGGGGRVLANASRIGEWEMFTRVEVGDKRIALRCPNGQYLSPPRDGGSELLANAADAGAWESFQVATVFQKP